jgi:hypothetical protein
MCERLYYKNGPPCELYTNEKTFPTDEKPSGRGLCLSKAMGIINGGDEKIGPNGKPEDSFQTTADLWNAYCKGRGMITHFKKSDTAMMMDLLKTARFTGQKYNPDNCVDKAGYTGLADDFKKEEAKTNGK